MTLKNLELKAEEIRLRLIEVVYKAKTGHIGGDLSSLNVLTTLYFHTLTIDPDNSEMEDRDRFIMSKGHSVEVLYCVLEAAGFITSEILDTYGTYNSILAGHPTSKVPGIEINGGSLGHGLSVGAGMAIAAKIDNKSYKTYVLMGDGELAEGSIYEAAMTGGHYKLDNLVAIIDRNGLQISNSTEKVMTLEPIKERWESLGWEVVEMDGDVVSDIVKTFDAIEYTNRKPHLIISKSTKGKGVSFMENVLKWHHGVLTEEEYKQAVQEIKQQIENLIKQDNKT